MLNAIVSGLGSSFLSYKVVKTQLDTLREKFAADPMVSREVQYFKENIGKMGSVKEMLDDFRLNQFITSAFNLESQSFAKAFVRKVIEDGTDDRLDLANKLVDPRYRDMATTFAYDTKGLANLSDPAWVNKMVDRYITQRFENDVGQGNPTVQTALYFERKAPDIKNWYDVLGDTQMFDVVRTYANLPASFSRLDVDKQVAKLSEKMDIKDFQDPAVMKKMVDRYLALSDVQSGAGAAGSTGSLALQTLSAGGGGRLTGFAPIVTIDPTLLLK